MFIIIIIIIITAFSQVFTVNWFFGDVSETTGKLSALNHVTQMIETIDRGSSIEV